jgi:cobalt-zinc-cadmium efflux system membrane fusion protein
MNGKRRITTLAIALGILGSALAVRAMLVVDDTSVVDAARTVAYAGDEGSAPAAAQEAREQPAHEHDSHDDGRRDPASDDHVAEDPNAHDHDAHDHDAHDDETHRHGVRNAGEPGHDDGDHDHKAFSVEEFERAGVGLRVSGPGTVDAFIELPGEVRENGDRIAHLAPRYAGIVREVRKYVGDQVRSGDVLAIVESENLSTFEVQSAFDGVVLEKHITPGEAVTRERPVYVVADLSSVWVDISVYHTALPEVSVGRPVEIRAPHEQLATTGTVSYVTPVVDPATRTATARVVLRNPDGAWRPGMFVSASILTPVEGAIVIPHDAVQRVGGEPTVFVVVDAHFVPRGVRLGHAGRNNVEVLMGLRAGERYAADRSFLVKAELAKGEAGHDH